MSSKPHIFHVFPADGGVARYAEVVSRIYKQEGFAVTNVVVGPEDPVSVATQKLQEHPDAIHHFEAGAGDSKIFAIARKTLKDSVHKQIMTIHDTGQFVRHPIDNRYARHQKVPVRIMGKLARKALSVTLGGSIRSRYLSSDKVLAVYLRPDIAEAVSAEYLPQPVYTQGALSVRKSTKKPKVLGYGGYWGHYKGLETIVEAGQEGTFADYRLIVSGGTAEETDSYSIAIRNKLLALKPPAELPGFVDDLDTFLLSLDVLMLPYWPELPSGTSAMAMRAAELGVPIIASNTPALEEQLGDGPIYIEPKSTTALIGAVDSLVASWSDIQADALKLSQRINDEHSWKTVGRRLSEIIEKVQ